MGSLFRSVTDQPFIRYLRAQPLETPPAPNANAGAAHDAAAPAAPAAAARPAANPHLAGIEKTWVAKGAQKVIRGTGWMSAMRLVSNNTPLLGIPKDVAPAATGLAAMGFKTGPFGVMAALIKDGLCQQLEGLTMNATYATRLARWSSRGAASLWYTAVVGLSQDDVRAWRSRPDYEYPSDCNPRSLSPKADPHCPMLAVGQSAEKMEPVIGALLIGAMGLSLVYAVYRFDLRRHKRPVADIETGGVRQPLLGASDEHAAAVPDAPQAAADIRDASDEVAPAATSSQAPTAGATASAAQAPQRTTESRARLAPIAESEPAAPSAAATARAATRHAGARDETRVMPTFDAERMQLATDHPDVALALMN